MRKIPALNSTVKYKHPYTHPVYSEYETMAVITSVLQWNTYNKVRQIDESPNYCLYLIWMFIPEPLNTDCPENHIYSSINLQLQSIESHQFIRLIYFVPDC